MKTKTYIVKTAAATRATGPAQQQVAAQGLFPRRGIRLIAGLVAAFALLWLSAPRALAQSPDMSASKGDDAGGAATLGSPFNWQIVLQNQVGVDAVFSPGASLLLDDLAPADYGAPQVAATGIDNPGTVDCTINVDSPNRSLLCQVGAESLTISGGGRITVTLPVTPTTVGTLANPVNSGRCAVDPDNVLTEADENNNACSGAVAVGAPDLTVTKTNNVAGALNLGRDFTWTVTLENQGDRAAVFAPQAWILEDELPIGARYSQPTIAAIDGVTGSVGCVIYNKILACQAQSAVTIAADGGKLTATFVVTPTALGTLTNSATVCKGDPQNVVAEADEGNNGCRDSVTVTGVDLQLTKRADRSLVEPGQTIRYTLAYTNAGNGPATGVTITETVPAGSNFNAAAGSAGWDCADGSPAGTRCRYTVGSLAVDGSGSVQFAVSTPAVFGTIIGAIENQAEIGDDGVNGVDFFSDDNQAGIATPVSGLPAVRAIQSAELVSDNDGDERPSPGDKLRYTVTITNHGTVPAGEVIFAATPDSHAPLAVGTVQSDAGTILSGNEAGQSDVRVALGALPPNQPVTLRFDVVIADPLPADVTAIENQSQISGANFAPVLTDDPSTTIPNDATVTPVNAMPILQATLIDALLADLDGDQRPSPGDQLRYTVTIRNRGNGAASSLRYDDTGSSYTSLIPGSVTVQDNQGMVLSGNGAGEQNVRVAADRLAGGGSTLVIRYDVVIAAPLPAGVTQIQRQGVVTSAQLPQFLTSDPDGNGGEPPTVTPLDVNPRLRATKRDQLLVDQDESGSPSPGDTLLYTIRIRNDGNAGALNVRLEDSLDDYLILEPSGVQTTVGQIVSGTSAEDRMLIVDIGDLPAGSEVEIALTATIRDGMPADVASVANQGVVTSDGHPDILTDDPDQPGTADPTMTLVAGDVVIYSSLQDYLLVDADGSGTLTRGDTLLYRLDVYNYGDLPARNGVVEIDSHPSLVLQSGSVRTDLGSVVAGNSQEDTEVAVSLELLAPGAQATITLEMVVDAVGGAPAVEQQAVIWFDNPRGDLFTVFSDDPATAAIGDRTVSALYGIREVAELFLPIIYR